MDNIGSEIGQKMRCAVKAKLIELGTGYIDDELPDYVMIMVANKRSKQQMVDDLSLFLGINTHVFVTWLHEVLEKLQEVTLPAAPSQKKSKRKDHEKRKKKPDSIGHSDLPVLPSITEVIKEGFIQRAKQVETKMKSDNIADISKKTIQNSDEFNIPTISDIAKEAAEKHQHEQELQQLAELQKKIYIAKKQLQTMVSDESDDDFNVSPTNKSIIKHSLTGIHVNPKYFAKNEQKIQSSSNIAPNSKSGLKQASDEETVIKSDKECRRVVKLSAVRRAEREIYIPAFRRPEMENRQNTRDRTRRAQNDVKNRKEVFDEQKRFDSTRLSRENPVRNAFRRAAYQQPRSRSQSPKRDNSPFKLVSDGKYVSNANENKELTRKKISSRIFVIQQKLPVEEEERNVPLNSIIKVKPRTHVPESKQANKMLLLRAVAEAQKSTFRNTSTRTENENLFQTRSIKDRLTIEVSNREGDKLSDDEYVPEPVCKTSESESENRFYIPKRKSAIRTSIVEINDETILNSNSTQFVVTLDTNGQTTIDSRQKASPKKGSIKDRIGYRMQIIEDEEAKQRRKERFEQSYETFEDVCQSRQLAKRHPTSKENESTSKAQTHNKHRSDQNSILPNEVKSEDSCRRRNRARTISPVNFQVDLTDEETRSCSSHEDRKETFSKEKRAKIKKLKPTRKFDDIPSLLSTVAVADSTLKVKPKERCKFFPNCRDGELCDFHHPSASCNAFPSCKFGDKCAYLHPLCKYNQTCSRPNCNYMHTNPIIVSVKGSAAPPLASSIFPSQNYKPISLAPLPAICKFFPKCSNTLCQFYHPKPCRFGKLCHNKIECNFYHQELPTKDKLKWVSSNM